jgi:hypothetical protein
MSDVDQLAESAEEVEPGVSDLVRRWIRIAYSTEPVDRAAAEAAVGSLYELALGWAPREIIWCESPARAARLVAVGEEHFGPSVREQVRTQPWHRARAELLRRSGRETWASRWQETCGEISPTVSRLVEQIGNAVAFRAKGPAASTRLRLALTFADHGQHDAAWLPLFESSWSELADGPILQALAAVAEQVHWWWPFENAVILCERPTELHLDERGRLHHGEGPALAYRDGFVLHRWHGIPIPAEFAQTLKTLTPQIIQEQRNVELRRMMLEHYGHERFIIESGAEPIQQDEAGKLWRVVLPRDEPITMVEVVNSTAEPDGSFRTYWLRVPPHTRTAREAVAWTFGLAEQEYRPQVQT